MSTEVAATTAQIAPSATDVAKAAVDVAKDNVPANVKDAFQQLLLDSINTMHQGIDATKQGIGTAVDFVSKQAPDVVHELLVWNATISGIWCFVGVVLFSVALYLWPRSWRYMAKNEAPTILINIMIGLGGFCIAIANMDWLKIIIAPKLWLLEYAMHIMKAAS